MSKILFLDTCVLLELQQKAFNSYFYISSITLTELENIKTSKNKDDEIKWKARQVLHLLQKNNDNYKVIAYNSQNYDHIIEKFGLLFNDDSRIIATAYSLKENVTFITVDLACFYVAKSIGLNCNFTTIESEDDEYLGYKTVQMEDDDLVYFYSKILKNNQNYYELKNNEYLLITDISDKIVDKYKWVNNHYEQVLFNVTESKMFGKITPKDDYQQIALDSLKSNQITMLRGPAGSGKDYLGLGYLFSILEKGEIDKIFIFVNPIATRGAAKLGYLPGDKNSKILDSQIGNFLIGKLGDIEIVYQMIDRGQLILMPISDIRGVDLSGTNSALYITEGQNMNIDMMKLALQRVGEDTKVILNGDTECQVDLKEYAGSNNGLKRVSKIFKGQKYYGEVTLQEIYRSKIARQADLM